MSMPTNKRRRNDETDHELMRSDDISDEQLKALDGIASELARAHFIVDRDHERRCQPIYEKRRKVFAAVPKFWPTAMKNHRDLSAFLQIADDQDAMAYLKEIHVQRDPKEHRAFTIEFHFSENPYFSDTVLRKEYQHVTHAGGEPEEADADGVTKSMLDFKPERDIKEQTFKINWKNDSKNLVKKHPRKGLAAQQDDEDEAMELGMGMEEVYGSFFHFFETVEPEELDFDLGTTISEDLYPDAMEYFTGQGQNVRADLIAPGLYLMAILTSLRYGPQSIFNNESDEEEDDDSEDDDDDASEIDLEKPKKKKRILPKAARDVSEPTMTTTRELYITGLPVEAKLQDITKLLEIFGAIQKLRVKPGFAFAAFEREQDAKTFMDAFHGHVILGSVIVIQWAITEQRRPSGTERLFARAPHRLLVTGLNKTVGWQDLKDFGRAAGNIVRADIDPVDSRKGVFVVDYGEALHPKGTMGEIG
ncbi:hypothetical protein FRB96_004193 [Tulasnella sp. 330]|nr:hypothetical protein FRB96_004193 [Tulasnella sp. 330]